MGSQQEKFREIKRVTLNWRISYYVAKFSVVLKI